jgi:hypothetical protein
LAHSQIPAALHRRPAFEAIDNRRPEQPRKARR